MTRDDIIAMAREAGLLNCDCCLPFWPEEDEENWKRFFVNFAALVAAAERERLAQPAMRRATRDEKIVRPGVYWVPVKQEPVAWMWKDGTVTADPDRADGTWTPLYTAPQR